MCGKASLEAIEVQGCSPIADGSLTVRADVLTGLPETLRAAQPVFEKTGGIHASGLFDEEGRLLALREDVGRHNALDKLIGQEFLAGRLPLADRIVLVSGRTSFELLQKAAMAGVPVWRRWARPRRSRWSWPGASTSPWWDSRERPASTCTAGRARVRD